MIPVDDDFKLDNQMVQRMVDLLQDGISVGFIVQGLKFHHVRPALTHYLKGPLVCGQSGLMDVPEWLSIVVLVERLTAIIAEHRAGEVGQFATYADVLAYLYPAAGAQLLPDRWGAIYRHLLNTTLARHELPVDETTPQTAGLTPGQEARLFDLRQELRHAIVRLARVREIAWPGRPLSVSSGQPSFRQLAQCRPERRICLNLTEKFNDDPKTESPSYTPAPKARRLPAPKIPLGLRPLPPRLSILPPDDNPHLNQIVRLIEQMAIMSGLSPYVLLRDWLGMLESGLKMWPANMRTMALEGQFIEDPPEIQAIFSQARERYLRVSEQRPAVYRQMQEAFSEAFALLLDSSTPGLEQINGNPDVIGQVFTTCLQPGRSSPWWRYFPDWPTALTVAQDALPEAHQLVYLVLAEAALQARAEGQAIQLKPGENFPEWFEVIWPYVEPLRLGPPLVSSSVELLAGAAQFPGWALKTGLVKFSWDPALEPLIQQLININAMLFGLNGYIVAHCEALLDIQEQLAQTDAQPVSTAAVYQLPPTLDETPEQDSNRQPKHRPTPGQSFADLFRHKSKP